MVEDDVLKISSPYRIIFLVILVSHAEAHETDYDIACINLCRISLDADAVTGSCLTGNSDISACNLQTRLEFYESRNIKDDGSRTGLCKGGTERACAAVSESRDMYHPASASACRIHSAAFGARECERLTMLVFRCRDLELSVIFRRSRVRAWICARTRARFRISPLFSGCSCRNDLRIRRVHAFYSHANLELVCCSGNKFIIGQ